MATGMGGCGSRFGVATGVDRLWFAAGMGSSVGIGGGVAHLAQHGGTTGMQETDEKERADGEEEDIENGGVVPGDGGVHDGEG